MVFVAVRTSCPLRALLSRWEDCRVSNPILPMSSMLSREATSMMPNPPSWMSAKMMILPKSV